MKDKFIIGWMIMMLSFILLMISPVFYKPDIINIYQKCNSWCIEENVSSLCDCKEIEETKGTVPLWYISLFFLFMIIGFTLMLLSWRKK